MPYKSEKIKLKDTQDRRRKITDVQREEIKELYKTGLYSWNTLADKYGVSKGTIGVIVSETRQASIKKYNKENWKDKALPRELQTEAIRKTRRYKQELYLKGELKED